MVGCVPYDHMAYMHPETPTEQLPPGVSRRLQVDTGEDHELAMALLLVDGTWCFQHRCIRGILRAPDLHPALRVNAERVSVNRQILCPDCGLTGRIRDGRWMI